MKPYEADATCPKCGNESISTQYHPATPYTGCQVYYCPSLEEPRVGEGFPEHFCRECGRCHYAWAEVTLDQQKKEA